jgi:WD40 repeat protein
VSPPRVRILEVPCRHSHPHRTLMWMTRVCLADPPSLADTFAAYFGPLSCVSWSPDSRFVAVGGQDDLVAIFSPRESRLVARCQGHSAFVTHIAFDPARGGGGGGYRFGSVGEDGKLLLVSGRDL